MRITVLYPALLVLFFFPFTQGIGSAASEVASLTEAKPGTYSHNGPAWRSLTPAPAPLLSGVVSTLAGGANDFADGLGTAARFSYPTDVACDGRGNVYVVDQGNHRIRRIVVATGVVSTLAGSGTEGFADGSGAAAQFNDPRGLAFDGRGHLYVADKGNHRIRCIATATGAVSTLTGSGTEGFADGTGTAAQFKGPADVACDSRGNLYVSDQSNHRVRRIVIATGVVSTLAGSSLGFADGQGSAAQFNYPTGLACDGRGHLYVADLNNHRIRCIATATGAVSTLAGSARGFADGPGPAAQFVNPAGVACDDRGHVFVADYGNHCIRQIAAATGVVSTLAGTGETRGYADGQGAAARFHFPNGLACDATGTLFVADGNNHRIRVVR